MLAIGVASRFRRPTLRSRGSPPYSVAGSSDDKPSEDGRSWPGDDQEMVVIVPTNTSIDRAEYRRCSWTTEISLSPSREECHGSELIKGEGGSAVQIQQVSVVE